MYKLADRRAAVGGIYCGAHGVWLGPAQLIRRNGDGRYQVRAAAEIEALLAAAYAAPPEAGGCIAGLQRIAKHLGDSNVALAMIAAVQLRFGEIAEERIERLARADTLLKANFNPDEPRDDHGRWTDATEVAPDHAEREGSSGGDLDGIKAHLPVTRAGIMAAAHREGAFATADYLDRVKANGLTSKGLRLKPQDLPIETRLRTFSGARHE